MFILPPKVLSDRQAVNEAALTRHKCFLQFACFKQICERVRRPNINQQKVYQFWAIVRAAMWELEQ
jgi:hypothetical protein